MGGKEEISLPASSSAQILRRVRNYDCNDLERLTLPAHVVIAVVIPVVKVAALMIAVAPIFAVIVPAMPLMAVVPVAVTISERDRTEIDLYARTAAITALDTDCGLDPAVAAVTIVIPVIVNCALLALIHAIIVMMAPVIPVMVSVPIAIAIADSDIAKTDLNADMTVIVALRSRSACRRKRCAGKSQCNDGAF
jgi:hypothetical protein